MPKKTKGKTYFQLELPTDLNQRLDILKAHNGFKSKKAQILALIEDATKDIQVIFKNAD